MSAKVPKQLQEQLAKAEEAAAELEAQQAQDEPQSEPPQPEPTEPTPQEEPPAEPQPAEETGDKDDLMAKIDALESEKDATEHKLKSELGRKDKAVRELSDEVGALRAELEALRSERETMQPLAQKPAEAEELFSEEDRELLGEDYIKMAEKVAAHKAQELFQQYKREMEAKLDNVQTVVDKTTATSLKERVLGSLGLDEARFVKIDNSPQFNSFLDQQDGLSGQTLGDTLTQAIGRSDAGIVTAIYSRFLDTLRSPSAVPPVAKTPQPTRVADTAKSAANANPTGFSSYDEVARAYAAGDITDAVKDEALRRLDEVAMQEISQQTADAGGVF